MKPPLQLIQENRVYYSFPHGTQCGGCPMHLALRLALATVFDARPTALVFGSG